MSKTKGKNVFNAKLREKYSFLEKTKNESVLCKKCNGVFSIASGGNADIVRHIKAKKHLEAKNTSAASTSIKSHFVSELDTHTAAMEGVWAYHVIDSNHSFKSSDCATKIFKSCFNIKKFPCSQKKCQAIVTNIFTPHAQKLLEKDLMECNYVSIYTDASNHGNIKLFPVLVRYFIPTVGVRVKILNLTNEAGENSIIISNLIESAAAKYNLEKKIVCFCGDNAKVNFGGETRGGQNNVFYRLKQWLPHLIGIGCVAHITHNALKFACEEIPFDVEWVIVKIYSHFYLNTVRATALKEFCELADVEYEKLLGYAKTRFLALGPAVKRVLKLWDALKSYFLANEKGEKKLKEFFSEDSSKFWLIFVQEQAELFANYVLKIEGDDVTAIEVAYCLNELEETLKMRQEDDFLSPGAVTEKQKLIEDGYNLDEMATIRNEFFNAALSYFHLWTAPFEPLKLFAWASLKEVPKWSDVEAVMKKLNEFDLYDANENAANLHTQFRHIKIYCTTDKIEQWRDGRVSIVDRWVEIFKHLNNADCEYKESARIVEYILCLPGTSASVERIFSAVNKTWTSEKTRLDIDTLKAILIVKVNLQYPCVEFYNYLKTKPEMLRQIVSKSKYKTTSTKDVVTKSEDEAV